MADLMLYQKLTSYLINNLPTRYRNHLNSWIDKGILINQGKQITVTGLELAHFRYTAVFLFDEFPYKKISASMVMALIQTWLNANDNLRCELDFAEIPVDIEIYDDETASITFDIEFQEPITANLDPTGNLEIDGQRFSLGSIDIYTTANELEIKARISE